MTDNIQRDAHRYTLGLILGVLALRLIYLIALNPYQLAADEAQYWDWSRNLSLSYYTKGPGIALLIGASVRLLGDHAWAVRLPAALCAAATMWILAQMAVQITADKRAGFYAAALFALSPAFIGTAQFMTIDPPLFTCWALSAWTAMHVFSAMRDGRSSGMAWPALGLALGIGFLFKYTILLLLPGLVLYALVYRRALRWDRSAAMGLGLAVVVFGLAISPVLIWNAQEGWPTVAHLLGRLGVAGGDMPIAEPSGRWNLLSAAGRLLEMIGTQVGIVSPPIVVLIGYGLWKHRHQREADAALMLWLALPVLLFYGAVAGATKVLANWPLAGFLTLLVVAALPMAGAKDRYRQAVTNWRADSTRPWRGVFRRKPETLSQLAWDWSVAVGVIVAIAIAGAPWLRGVLPVGAFHRVTGHDLAAAKVEALQQALGDQTAVITDAYGKTALLAFYLPGQPVVYSAAHRLGDRPSPYDYFATTDLTDPHLRGRPVVLVGSTIDQWRQAFKLGDIEPSGHAMGGQLYRATDYQGPIQEHP